MDNASFVFLFQYIFFMSNHVSNKLREMRLRAGLSMDKLAKALGYKGQSSYQRYEDEQLYRKQHLPNDLIEGLLEVLPGKGDPPILPAEILQLSGAKLLLNGSWDDGNGHGLFESKKLGSENNSPGNLALEEIKALYKDRNDVGFFIVSGNELNLRGIYPGDVIVTSDKIKAEKGAMVCVNVYDDLTGTARTEFRIYEPPNAIAVSTDPSIKAALPVDGERVMLRGTISRIIRNLIS